MKKQQLVIKLNASLTEANEINNENRSREMSLVITKIEEAQLWLSKLK